MASLGMLVVPEVVHSRAVSPGWTAARASALEFLPENRRVEAVTQRLDLFEGHQAGGFVAAHAHAQS